LFNPSSTNEGVQSGQIFLHILKAEGWSLLLMCNLTCEYEPLLIFYCIKLRKILANDLCPKYPNFGSLSLS